MDCLRNVRLEGRLRQDGVLGVEVATNLKQRIEEMNKNTIMKKVVNREIQGRPTKRQSSTFNQQYT